MDFISFVHKVMLYYYYVYIQSYFKSNVCLEAYST